MRRPGLLAVLLVVTGSPSVLQAAQQVAETLSRPDLAPPTFPGGEGPVVLVDAAHGNFHTADGRYRPFAQVMERDGWTVRSLRSPLTPEAVAGARVIVIANALDSANRGRWVLPIHQAFTEAERAALHGFAMGTDGSGIYTFRAADGSLAAHGVTRGLDSVRTFTGQAMRIRGTGVPLLAFRNDAVVLLPEEAWQFTERTPRVPAAGLHQAVLIEHGRGRVAIFGEAAMFTAQRAGAARTPMGMNAPGASQNARLLQGVMRWLIGREDE